MNEWWHSELFLAGVKAFAVTVILTPILRDIFRSYNVVDQPGQRRVHIYPVPRIGGIPIALGYAFAIYSLSGVGLGLGAPLLRLAPGAAVVFLTGLIDDFFNLRPRTKLMGQILAALVVFWSGLSMGTLGSDTPLPLWINLPLTVFWLLLTTNALNLIDGLDGLCAGIGLVATIALFGAALLYGNDPLAYATLPLAGSLVAFLFYNINPATVFLGDSGALLIGFLLGCYGMIWTQKTSTLLSLLVPLIVLSVPLLDVSVAIVRRKLSRQPIFGADRGHIHHRLLDRGLKPKHAVLILYLFAALVSGLGLILVAPQLSRARNLILGLLVAAIFFGLRELQFREFRMFGKLLFQGKHLRGQIHMDYLEKSLMSVRNTTEWWNVLTATAEEYGWHRLRWSGPEGIREFGSPMPGRLWTLRVDLAERGHLEIEGGEQGQGLDLVQLSRLLAQSRPVLETAEVR